jgi:integrase/recombinase XerD
MGHDLIIIEQSGPPGRRAELPALVERAGGPAAQAWTDFFDGKVRNGHTRKAYQRAVRHFLAWCEQEGLELPRIRAGDVGRYLSQLAGGAAKKKGTLAALRRYFRLLVERHICLINPAAEAETVRYDVVEGKTPEITDAQFRALVAAIDATTLVGLRDRLIIKTLAYTGARVGALAALQRHHYYEARDQWMLHFDEKRGKSREIPVAHDLKLLFDGYLERSGIQEEKRTRDPATGEWEPIYLFRTAAGRTGQLTKTAMNGTDIYKMMRRHAERAGMGSRLGTDKIAR